MNSKKPILLAEDDQVDQETIRRALKEIKVTNELVITNNGEEALAYLRDGKGESPCLILLDIKMPKMDGIQFLKIIKEDKSLRKIPVVILTSSREEQDRVNSFDLSVAGYMAKPVEYKQFLEVIRAIDLYWTLSELAV